MLVFVEEFCRLVVASDHDCFRRESLLAGIVSRKITDLSVLERNMHGLEVLPPSYRLEITHRQDKINRAISRTSAVELHHAIHLSMDIAYGEDSGHREDYSAGE
jgi:hypothetical protein